MIPVTCYKLQGFSFSYKRYGRISIPYLIHTNDMEEYQSPILFIQTIWKNTNPLSELHATAQYCVRKIPYPNLYTESPEK